MMRPPSRSELALAEVRIAALEAQVAAVSNATAAIPNPQPTPLFEPYHFGTEDPIGTLDLPFRITKESASVVSVKGGNWERNGTKLTLATATQNIAFDTTYVYLQLDDGTLPTTLTLGVSSTWPADTSENKYKVLAAVTLTDGTITAIVPYWVGDIDDVFSTGYEPDNKSLSLNASDEMQWYNWTAASSAAAAADDLLGLKRGTTDTLRYTAIKEQTVVTEVVDDGTVVKFKTRTVFVIPKTDESAYQTLFTWTSCN